MKSKKIRLLKALAFPVSAWFAFTIGTSVIQAEETTNAIEVSNVEEMNEGENNKESTNVEISSSTEDGENGEEIEEVEKKEDVSYSTHVQDIGWQEEKNNGETSGTVGEAKRLEAISIKLDNQSDYVGDIIYQTHVQYIGWQDWKKNGEISGTTGQSLRLEAIRIQLTDEWNALYTVIYRVHCQDYGWLDWVENGEIAGTVGQGKRLEGIEIKLLKKSEIDPSVSYKTHIQDQGWESTNKKDGQVSGTTGSSKRLEAIEVKLNDSKYEGSIAYKTHIQNQGWESEWHQDNDVSGTIGQSLRLEAIQIKLLGEIADYYDVYYRVHCQDYGWLGWAKNGESAGTEGLNYRLEAIEIKLMEKGIYITTTDLPFIKDTINFNYQSYLQNEGWQDEVSQGSVSGTTGENKDIEAIRVYGDSSNSIGVLLNNALMIRVHVTNDGWLDWSNGNFVSGKIGQNLIIQALQMQLNSSFSKYYNIYYRSHISDYGWLDWAMNGATSGSTGLSKGLQAYEVQIVSKNKTRPISKNSVSAIQDYVGYDQNGKTLSGWKVVNDTTMLHFNSKGALSRNTVVDGKTLNANGFIIQSSNYSWDGPVLTAAKGVNEGPSGKETYYNLDMTGVLTIMRSIGNTDLYWIRYDGVKMLGDYVMIAANLSIRPRGSYVPTSLGMGIVCDTGEFIFSNPTQIDIATNW